MESRRSGVAVAAAGLVLVVVLFILLSGGDDGGTSGDSAAAPAGGYGSPPPEQSADDDEPKTDPKPGSDKPDEPSVPTIEIENGEPVGGVQEIEFESGSEAEFEVITDAADELHFHGYDLYVDVKPGKANTVSFRADIEGLFELESHTTGTPFAEISVVPG